VLLSSGCVRAPTVEPQPSRRPAMAPATPRSRPSPIVLAPAELAYVADAGGGFPSMLSTPGPRLVLAVLDEPPAFVDAEAEGVQDVADEALATIGVARPSAVWLPTPSGTCRAALGSGYVGHYAEGVVAYEVGYHLKPCAPVFGPIGVLADDAPPELRWVAATVELDEQVELDAWAHPMREAFLELGLGTHVDEAGAPAPVRAARISTVEGTSLRQLVAVDHWPAPEPCNEVEAVTIGTGLWDGTALRWLPTPEPTPWEPHEPQLVGALVDGRVPVVVVYTVRFQAMVGTRDAAGEYRWSEISTGRYHDEDVAFSGYSRRQHCGP
jgi:hypothetical protein